MNSQFDYLKAIIKPTKTKQKKMMEKKIRGGWRDVCSYLHVWCWNFLFRHASWLDAESFKLEFRSMGSFPPPSKKIVIRTKNTDLWFRRYHHFLQACDYLHHRFFKWVNRPRDRAQTSWHVLQMSLMKRKQKSENLFLAITSNHLLKPRSSAIADRPW